MIVLGWREWVALPGLGLAAVRAVPVVRATVEVRNAFGNVASHTVDVVLDASTAGAHAALRLEETVR